MKKVVAYGIYNNEKGVRDFENSIRKELANHKEWKLERQYIDENKQYISFGKLLNETTFKDIDIILIKNIKQFYQVTSYAINFFTNYLEEKRIEIIFLDEKISTLDRWGKTQLQIMITMLESYKEASIRRTKKDKDRNIDDIAGKYQVNGRETTDINERLQKELDNSQKEKANKSRSEKMKELWKNEEYRKRMIEKIKVGKKLKKR